LPTGEERLISDYKNFKTGLDMSGYSDENGEFLKQVLFIFEQGIDNVKRKNYDMAFLAFFCVVEGIASKKYFNRNYVLFESWISDNRENIEIPETENPDDYAESVKNNLNTYRETYGSRRNFVKIILEKYRETQTAPSFLANWEVIRIPGGARRAQMRSEPFESLEDFYSKLETYVRKIYDDYRNPLVHSASPLNFIVRISSQIGGISTPLGVSAQSFGSIVLDVLKYHIAREPFTAQ